MIGHIDFIGGARTVTGSRHLLTIRGKRILLDCGLFQGRRQESYQKNLHFPFDPSQLHAVILSHAHIDHSGNLPNLVGKGFEGPIISTAATLNLCQLMLRDSAYLQERDVEWVNRMRKKRQEPPLVPLYTKADVDRTMSLFVALQYDRPLEVVPGVRVTFRDAGHILGSAGVLLEIERRGRPPFRLGFSGDIGRKEMPLLRDPHHLFDLDCLIMESTYGNRLHRHSEDVQEELAETVRRVAERGGKIIIPAFAVGRAQGLVYRLHKLYQQNRIPDLPIFVDSPLACNATEVFRLHPECFDDETYRLFLEDDLDPFGFGQLRYVRKVEESKRINTLRYPHIVISASGMAEGGRVLHHLRNSVEDPRHLVLLVGYAAPHTLARKLLEGHEKVRIFGESHRVRCQVKFMEDFSAHADRRELLEYLEQCPPQKLRRIFLVHGEEEQALPLRHALRSQGYPQVFFPAPGERYPMEAAS